MSESGLCGGIRAAQSHGTSAAAVTLAPAVVVIAADAAEGSAAVQTARSAARLVRPGSKLGKVLGRPNPVKSGSGGMQPYDAATGRYLPRSANPGLAKSPAADFAVGFGQGFLSEASTVDAPFAMSTAQEWGQAAGRIAYNLLDYF